MQSKESLIGLRRRFGLELGGDDVEHRIEMPHKAQPLQHGIDMNPACREMFCGRIVKISPTQTTPNKC